MSDREAFLASADVSRETLEMLDTYAKMLASWNRKINLVSNATLPVVWSRHFQDSLQVAKFVPEAKTWADLGSGGGFPGAVVAICRPELRVSLVESDQRKCAFLRALARETRAFTVIPSRIEALQPLKSHVVSARALAPLATLLGFADRHLAPGGRAIFLKGKKADEEIADALEYWRFDCEKHASTTDEEAVILSIGEIERV